MVRMVKKVEDNSVTARERVLAVMNRLPVDKIPVDIWHTDEVLADLKKHFAVEDSFELYRQMGVDKIVWITLKYLHPENSSDVKLTNWGVPVRSITSGAAAYEEFASAPLSDYPTIDSLDNYPGWPDPENWNYDQATAKTLRAHPEFATLGPWVSFFEIYCQLRGLEQSMYDLILDPDYVDAVLDRIEYLQTEMMKRFFARVGDALDFVFLSDDMAGQDSLLMSPEMWDRHLRPRMTRWCEWFHSLGYKVFYHSDGAVEPLVPALIECGIDLLNPIQHACPGMEMKSLREKFGQSVVFHGGVDNQHVLPFGSVQEVRDEVKACVDALSADGGGFICCSCHNVQAGTPVENVLAMIRAVNDPD